MAARTVIGKAIAKAEGEIAVLQQFIARLREQQKTPTPRKKRQAADVVAPADRS